MILLATLALAAPLRLASGPASTAEVLPVVETGRVDILVRNGDADAIGRPFAGRRLDGVRAGRVTNFGGHLLVTAWMRDAGDTLALVRTAEGWEARPVPIAAATGPAAERCELPPKTALLPLHGEDMLAELPQEVVRPTVARWELAEPNEVNWGRVDALRSATFGGGPPGPDLPRNLYALGALHRELGHAREAAYYFGEAVGAGAPAGVVRLQQASALLGVGDYEGARAALDAAPDAAPSDRAAVQAVLALRTGAPAALATGRDLAGRADRPDLAVLAGALLLRANCWTEAAAVLDPVAGGEDLRAPFAALLLSEALLLDGKLDAAARAVGRIERLDLLGPLRSLVRARSRLVSVAKETPAAWPGVLPVLDMAGRTGDSPEALDALYLRGQIAETLGDDDLALEAYVALVDRRRALLAGEPGQRLVTVWKRRVEGLFEVGRELDALVVHLGAWRPGLADHLSDPTPLLHVAEAWIRQGMAQEALDVLTEVAAIQGLRGLDDRATVLAIADAYRATGRFPEALEALDFLATRPAVDDAVASRAVLVRGRTLAESGDLAGARAAWTSLVAPPRKGRPAPVVDPEVAAEATLRLAIADAAEGRCEPLLALPVAAPPPDVSAAWLDATRSTCLAKAERPDEARTAAKAAADGFVDPASADWARGLAGEPTDTLNKQLVAADVAEDAADAALRARLDALRGRTP